MYYSAVADNNYRKILRESRSGIDKSPEAFQEINDTVKKGLKMVNQFII